MSGSNKPKGVLKAAFTHSMTDTNVVVSPTDVELGEVAALLQLVQ